MDKISLSLNGNTVYKAGDYKIIELKNFSPGNVIVLDTAFFNVTIIYSFALRIMEVNFTMLSFGHINGQWIT